MSSLEKIHRGIEAAFPSHLEAIRDFVRHPSISADGTGIAETAEKVKGFIESVGGQAEIVPTQGHPVVYGELYAARPKTLLIYGMYDVQPVVGEEWLVPPFAGETVELPKLGPAIVARGIYNTKGPLLAFFKALAVQRQVAELPVNLTFVIEGEEEQGSPHLADFVHEYKQRLVADAAFFPFFTMNSKGRPMVYLGAKGNMKIHLACTGGPWGGPTKRAIHSRNAAWVASPVWKLLHALATLVDRDESITVDGFYHNLRKPSEEDEELIEQLAEVFDERVDKDELDILRFKYDLKGAELLKKYLFSPTININGLVAGHIDKGIKTVLPHKALAKLDIRLPPDMTVENTLARIRAHLDKYGFADVSLEKFSGYPSSRTSVREWVVQALIRSCLYHGYQPEIWPYIPGSAPFYLFTRELGLPLAMGGLAHGGRAHSPNEFAVIDQIKLFEKSMITFLHLYAEGT